MLWAKELSAAIAAAELSKRAILEIYKSPFEVEIKSDDSPVTKADKESDKIIREYLSKKFPTHAFLTEESCDDKSRLNNDYVWIIDPLDGTSDFVAKNDEFTINIALTYKHKVVVGVVMIPVTNEIYYATRCGGAFYSINGTVREIHVNYHHQNLRVMISRSHHGEKEKKIIDQNKNLITEVIEKGAAMKPCLIAKGMAELSIRLNDKTKEWDTAAPDLIVKEAGGLFITPSGKNMEYNRDDVINHEGYIIVNRKATLKKITF